MIEQPPKNFSSELLQKALFLATRPDLQSLLNDANDNYWYWSDAKYKKIPSDITIQELWLAIKFNRLAKQIFVWDKYGIKVSFCQELENLRNIGSLIRAAMSAKPGANSEGSNFIFLLCMK